MQAGEALFSIVVGAMIDWDTRFVVVVMVVPPTVLHCHHALWSLVTTIFPSPGL